MTLEEKSALALDALRAIAVVVGGPTGATATVAIGVVQSIIAAVTKGLDGEMSYEATLDELAKLRSSIEGNDDAADEALTKKFLFDAKPETD